MAGRLQIQDPAAKLDWTFSNWADRLPSGDPIATHAWTIDPSVGPTIGNESGAVCTVTGLSRGKTYVLTDHIVTTGGIIDEQSITLVCEST